MSNELNEFLLTLPLNNKLLLYNDKTVNSYGNMGECAIRLLEILPQLKHLGFDDDCAYVCSFYINNKPINFKNQIYSSHVFLYNENIDMVIDPLLARSFNNLDLYIYFLSQLYDLKRTYSSIDFIYHKFDLKTKNILKATCKPQHLDATLLYVYTSHIVNLPLNELDNVDTRNLTCT